jgi:hypothetical protein
MYTHLKLKSLAFGGLLAMANSASALPLFADVVAIVDESGSMAGEHAWLGGMVTSLDTGLNTAGLTPNNFGLVGFGASGSGGHAVAGHQHDVGGVGSEFGTAAEFSTATGGLVISGGFEDGYSGIALANTYGFRSDAARNYILVTDEDRDNGNNSLTYANMLSSMTSTNTLLNAVVNATFRCGDNSSALGIDSAGNGYKADGSGDYTTCTGATAISGFGTTIADYVNLALATGGAAWDLNQLRAGGNTATSFTNAFVDLKIQEIQEQEPIPEPASLALLGLGLTGIFLTRRKNPAA